MVVIFHNGSQITEVLEGGKNPIALGAITPIISMGLLQIATQFPDALLVWCHSAMKAHLNIDEIPRLLHHQRMMCSFSPLSSDYFSEAIGYVEDNPFTNISKEVTYPTWQMSASVGCVHASVLLAMRKAVPYSDDFNYYLNSFAKVATPCGLLCYSEPRLLTAGPYPLLKSETSSYSKLFVFIKQHYKKRWLLLLWLNLLLYERRFVLFPVLYSLFFKKLKVDLDVLKEIKVHPSLKNAASNSISVVIPTMGRKKYLYDVLKDLSNQTQLPQQVIIVEQNGDITADSELDYLTTKAWPFEIAHIFIHQTGACNARNLALEKVSTDWVFFADDDIRLPQDFFEKGFKFVDNYHPKAFTVSCLRQNEKEPLTNIVQWKTFGSGCSWVKSSALKDVHFNLAFEHGFGEDADFGMQLRKKGFDILYNPFMRLTHLKAPTGGFRKVVQKPWETDAIVPKPSPTVMAFKLLHSNKSQLNGYKTLLFFKFYRKQPIKNPFSYISEMNKRFASSILWAKRLLRQNE